MNTLYNQITLRNKQAVILDTLSSDLDDKFIHALIADIAQLGYTVDGDVISALKSQSESSFLAFHTILVAELKDMVGANVKYRPLFKKFPEDIPDDMEYYKKRVVGFLTNLFDLTPENVAPLSCGHVIDSRLFNMDDFGAGASGFQYLKAIEADYVKIDGMYIRDALGSRNGRAFLKSMAELCRDLGIKTVGECVEDTAQAEFLKKIGVDYGQGYLFGRPEARVSGSCMTFDSRDEDTDDVHALLAGVS